MDDVIGTDPGAWLAVTSLSFDISVLELFWTLTRGFTVVLADDATRAAARRAGGGDQPAQDGVLPVYYWGNDDLAPAPRSTSCCWKAPSSPTPNGFCAVWTPERHFHAFGGPYPNPSVTGAAVAAVTKNIGVRAGSCVAPLHHPARIAEEWAVIDNLTNGRAGMAIASGWQPDDFRAAAREHAAREPAGHVRRDRPGAPSVARRGGGLSAQGRRPFAGEDPAPPGVEGSCRSGSPPPATPKPGARPGGWGRTC